MIEKRKQSVIVAIVIIVLVLLTSCKNNIPYIGKNRTSVSFPGTYMVEWTGNTIGAPAIWVKINNDSTFDYHENGDCYRRLSHGRIKKSISGKLIFESFVDDPSQFSCMIRVDSLWKDKLIDINIDSSFDAKNVKWFLISDEKIIEYDVNTRHLQFSPPETPAQVRIIGLRNEKRCRYSTERHIVCSQNITIDSSGVYSLTTDTAFASHPLDYIPINDSLSIDNYGNLLMGNLYFYRQK